MSTDSNRIFSSFDAPDPGDPSLFSQDLSSQPIRPESVDSPLVEIIDESSLVPIDDKSFNNKENLSGRNSLVPSESAKGSDVIESETATPVETGGMEGKEAFRKSLKIQVLKTRRDRQQRRKTKFLVVLVFAGILLTLFVLSFIRATH